MVSNLTVLMNGLHVGTLSKASNGAHSFVYSETWLTQRGRRPISLSLPLRSDRFEGDEVFNFFDNLLPDNPAVRDRIVVRHQASTTQPFDLLAKVGRDAVGAITLLPEDEPTPDHTIIDAKPLTEDEVEAVLKGYLSDAPLGMIDEQDDFRISIAGQQEKTALLWHNGYWNIPKGLTPTTHIIKLPIGELPTAEHTLDLTTSVDNELVCMRLSEAFGIPTAHCDLLVANEMRVLAVERFDRRLSSDGSHYLRLPFEDFCQVNGLPSATKYESHGGVGIASIMKTLSLSENPEDRRTFMRSQILFWLLAAIDGHSKNFSIGIGVEGRYHLAPLYDILSAYPMLGGKGLNHRKLKLAMSHKGSSGRKYRWAKVLPRHFGHTAREVGLKIPELNALLQEFADTKDAVIDKVA
ncbi:type II toxin-antitoxin system HipA family toxin, partial [Vibrio breoganii]|uniref:type II toxin-antitoxin system HipA family toxin n=1 Tax=Vibrio breoganii TaxID=553239 RepID=UPI000C8615A1